MFIYLFFFCSNSCDKMHVFNRIFIMSSNISDLTSLTSGEAILTSSVMLVCQDSSKNIAAEKRDGLAFTP